MPRHNDRTIGHSRCTALTPYPPAAIFRRPDDGLPLALHPCPGAAPDHGRALPCHRRARDRAGAPPDHQEQGDPVRVRLPFHRRPAFAPFGQVLPGCAALHRLRHRERVHLPVGRAAARPARRRSGLVRLLRDALLHGDACDRLAVRLAQGRAGVQYVSDNQYRLPVLKPEGNVPESPRIGGEENNVPVLVTRLDESIGFFERALSDTLGWARKFSMFQYPFVTACCGMEYMSAMAGRYDIARFGAEFPRFTPRQADLLMIVGTINIKQAPVLKRVYDQMTEPKWVMAFGVCASSGGFYDNYATVQGADRVIPVDVYVPGCPPRPEQVLDGLKILQEKIQTQRHQLHSVEKPPELDDDGKEKRKRFLGRKRA